jgi:hypothetical protein
MLMSFDTRMTGRLGNFFCRWITTDRIWLSTLEVGSPAAVRR